MSFLSHIANNLLQTYGTDLSRVVVVFPNKRASLFLNEALASASDVPVWSPTYITISQLFRSHSARQVADPIKLICDLHKSFISCTGIDESLEHFYSWGQVLLADFDDVDKHQAPANKVFASLHDIHYFDDDSYLTEQQRDTLKRFFSHFNSERNSELKQRFLSLWNHIYDIYVDFNHRLEAQSLAYEGALYREVAETTDLTFEYDHYLFVGFNLLHPVEQTLIHRLEALGKAQLINDTDEETPKHITILSAPTENIQARYVATWLTPERIAAGRRTAVVMADEHLLQSVIHCLPDTVEKVNITTGYPLAQTAIATDVLQHTNDDLPTLMTFVQQQAKSLVSSDSSYILESEACFMMYTLLTRLQSLVEAGDLDVPLATLQRLLIQFVGTTSIPFHGEPIEGIQIMGVLETRNLQFDNILLLSCNEGNLPRGVSDTSFIPYVIRKAYGLTTIDHKVAIYEAYFRRLLQRAADVTLVYNNATTDGKTGEMSRFMLQMMVDARHPISFGTLQAGQQTALHKPQHIVKSSVIMQSLLSRTKLSPSALSRYLRCPLQFFFRDITGLDEPDQTDDTIDNRLFGNIFHRAAQLIYERLRAMKGGVNRLQVTPSDLDELIKDEVAVQRAVDQAIGEEFFHLSATETQLPLLDGLQLINREVILHYIHQLLELDRRLAPFTILALEHNLQLPPDILHLPANIVISGIADRIDEIPLPDGTSRIRIIDYKTGASHLHPLADIDAIFDPTNVGRHSHYYLQAFLYACIVSSRLKHPQEVSPALLFIQHAGVDDYDPTLKLGKTPISDISTVSDDFLTHLQSLIDEIYNPGVSFTPTDDRTRCQNCPYANLCGV